jgi:hypothetical protein
MGTILEADPSMWRAFHRLPPEAKADLKVLLQKLEQNGNWQPEAKGKVDNIEVCLKTLSGGWVCAWIPVYPPSTVISLTIAPEKIILCLYEYAEVTYL